MRRDGTGVGAAYRCTLRIGAEPGRLVRDYLASRTDRELGGFLLGHARSGDASSETDVDEAVPCPEAPGDLERLTFTPACWQRVHTHPRVRDERAQIVGWFHSHPGMPTRMSARDQWIQRTFFDAPFHVAWIRDPIGEVDSWWRWTDAGPGSFDDVRLDGGAP